MAPLDDGIWHYEEGESASPTFSELLNKLGDSVRSRLADDTGWETVPLAGGFTATNPVQVRRIGQVVYWRGRVTRDAGNFVTAATAIVPAGGVPVWARPTSSFSDTTSPVISVSGVPAVATVDTAGALTLAVSASVGAAASIFLKGLSGYTVN